MKIQSLSLLWNNAKETLVRFPFVLLCAIGGAVTFFIAIDFDEFKNMVLSNLSLTFTFGLIFTYGVKMLIERYNPSKYITYIIYAASVIALVVFYFLLPEKDYSLKTGLRLFVCWIALHLFSSFAPYTGIKDKNGFWHYNKALFLTLLTAILYSVVLYTGLSLAFLAIQALFNVTIDSKTYIRLAILIFGIFNTWFFLARVPRDFESLRTNNDYPKGLKVFTQYVLLPLVVIYLCILYAYAGKIVVLWNLPKGWVSYLVLFFSVAGIFSLLLIEPIKNEEGHNWIRVFSKWFYIALFPLVLLLFIAIGFRVADYGITENRYFVLLLAIWLAGIALYFLISKEKSIKNIPVSLCILSFASVIGPWGAFQVSETSQQIILENLLEDHKLIGENGKIVGRNKSVPDSIQARISSIVRFFDERENVVALKHYFTVSDTFYTSKTNYDRPRKLIESAGLKYSYGYYKEFTAEVADEKAMRDYYFSMYMTEPIYIKGYDYFTEVNLYFSEGYEQVPIISTMDKKKVTYSLSSKALGVKVGDNPADSIRFDQIIKALSFKYPTGQSFTEKTKEMEIYGQTKLIRYKILFERLSFKKNRERTMISDIGAKVLITLK